MTSKKDPEDGHRIFNPCKIDLKSKAVFLTSSYSGSKTGVESKISERGRLRYFCTSHHKTGQIFISFNYFGTSTAFRMLTKIWIYE